MTISPTYFWDGPNYHGEEELERMVDSFMTSGVGVSDDGTLDLAPSIAVSGSAITLAKGTALSGGHFYTATSAVTVTPSSGCYGLKCSLMIRTKWASKTTEPVIVAGTAQAAPNPTRNFGTTYDICICTFTVGSSGAISNLVDKRTDTTKCGAIRARGMSEMDEYFADTKTKFEDLIEEVSALTGWVQLFVQTATPSPVAAGALWFRTDKNLIMYYNGSSWTRVGRIMDPSDRIFGVTINNDAGPTGKRFSVPFDIAKVNMSSSTTYAQLTSGKAKIKKSGVYRVTLSVVISSNAIPANSASTGKWHFAILRNDSSSVPVGEGYFIADKYTEGSNVLNQCAGTVSGIRYFASGDTVSASCFLDQTGAKRVAADRTYMVIEPIDLEF